MAWELELSGPVLEELYVWIDTIPLSKPKKRIERDFSDGVLVAEVVRHYLPDLINMHNYAQTSSFNQKKINWGILNKKVLNCLGLDLPESIIIDLCNGKPGTVETFLYNLKLKIDEEIELRQKVHQDKFSTSRQSLLSLNNLGSLKDNKSPPTKRSSRTSRSIGNLSNNKWISRIDYEELKQHSLQQQEEIEILHAKLRRLEHVVQLKDMRINELSAEEFRHKKPIVIVANRSTKK